MDVKLARLKVAEYARYFDLMYGKPVTVSFPKITFTETLHEVRYATIGSLHNKPDKIEQGGKMISPAMMQIVFRGNDDAELTLDVKINAIRDIQRTDFTTVMLTIGDIEYVFCQG